MGAWAYTLSQVLSLCVCVWPAHWPPQTSNWILLAVTTTTELYKPYPTYWDEMRSGEGEDGEESRNEKVKKEEKERERERTVWTERQTHTHTHIGKEREVGRGGEWGQQAESETCCCCISVFFMSRQFTGRLFTVWYLALLGHGSQNRHPLPSSTGHTRLLLFVYLPFTSSLLFIKRVFNSKDILSWCCNVGTVILTIQRWTSSSLWGRTMSFDRLLEHFID